MIINLHSVVCIYIWLHVEYHNCSLYAMSTIAYKRPPLLQVEKTAGRTVGPEFSSAP